MEGEELSEEQIKKLLFEYTSEPNISIAKSSQRKFGTEYSKIETGEFNQIMSDGPFFNWYILERPYHQFFSTLDQAALAFLKYHKKWCDLGKPS